ncbi:MAG: hypothetical protein WC671_00935 [Candidatus Paceibacterota bacterium]|jgi:D-alanine-D-alanine ligase-like ATP-grasp enzyme
METGFKKRVGVLRGGAGKNYLSSIKNGGDIILHISEKLGDKYKVVDILVDKDYIWHLSGIPINTSDLVNKVDVVWNTTHSSFSSILDSLDIPNVRISSFYSKLKNNRELLREHMKQIGLNTPRFVIAPKNAEVVFKKFGSPWIIKNSNEIKIIKTFNELAKNITGSDDLIVEEFIAGKVVSVHSVRKFRGEEIYVFPLGNSFSSFSFEEKEKIFTLVKDLNIYIGGMHYLKIDFILNPHGKVYLLQIDEMPDLNSDSHFSQVCEYVGAKPHHVIEHILEQVL